MNTPSMRSISPKWKNELEELYEKRETLSAAIDSLERYALMSGACEMVNGDISRRPCQRSFDIAIASPRFSARMSLSDQRTGTAG